MTWLETSAALAGVKVWLTSGLACNDLVFMELFQRFCGVCYVISAYSKCLQNHEEFLILTLCNLVMQVGGDVCGLQQDASQYVTKKQSNRAFRLPNRDG